MTVDIEDDENDLSRYRVHSRREIITLLRAVSNSSQLVRLQANHGKDSVITSMLDVDDAANRVVIDCAPSKLVNDRILASQDIEFETVLENIRILFSASHIESYMHDNRPALSIEIPQSMVRLQRREYYRVSIPANTLVRCTIPLPSDSGNSVAPAVLPVYNVSGGGIAVVDEKKQFPAGIGTVFEKCRIDIPGSPIDVSLQLMNVHDITLTNGKNTRRLGFMFAKMSNAAASAVHRYITRLERERNARVTGMR